jgi:hypothetical protein
MSYLPKVMCAFPDLHTCHLGRVQGLREDAEQSIALPNPQVMVLSRTDPSGD